MASQTFRTPTRLLAMALASASTAALAQSQSTAPTSTSDTAAANQAGQDIIVTGIRGSLDKSVEIKRQSAVVLDSVNATELGRFPDSDVADSLQHITGITINRTTGGEGQYVSVRGLGSQYNITTLNDRILATDDDGRDFAFDILPADVISGADVLKSPQAAAVEGLALEGIHLQGGRIEHRLLHRHRGRRRQEHEIAVDGQSEDEEHADHRHDDVQVIGARVEDDQLRVDVLFDGVLLGKVVGRLLAHTGFSRNGSPQRAAKQGFYSSLPPFRLWGKRFFAWISSVSSMSAVLTAPVAAWILGPVSAVPVLALVAVIVVVQHRANIGRLLSGTEPKVGGGKDGAA